MPALDINSFLTPGTQYTMSFSMSTLAYVTNAFDNGPLLAALQGMSGVSSVSVNFPTMTKEQVDVTFIYSGDGSDVAANLAGAIIQAFDSATSGSYDYIGTVSGATAPGFKPLDVSALVRSSSGLWALAVIAIVAVFLFSGGAGLVRRAAG